MFKIELLPAGCGDCLWLEYGKADETPHIVLIDGGVEDTAGPLADRIQEAIRKRRATSLHIDLLVVTHIDNDHIRGILKLLKEAKLPLTFGDIWFNGNRQLANLPPPTEEEHRRDRLGGGSGSLFRPDLLGLKEGDCLSQLLDDPTRRLPWNQAFQGKEVAVSSDCPLPVKELDGLKLTILGPPRERLRRLAVDWKKFLKDFERGVPESARGRKDILGKGDTWPPLWRDRAMFDDRPANGSSIALWAEYGEQALLLTGDAFAKDVAAGLSQLQVERKTNEPLPLSAFKLSHHGSAQNLSMDLLKRINCSHYLISTDGSVYRHPDQQALLRILRYGGPNPLLMFNYAGDTTRNWHDHKEDVLKRGFPNYDTAYPETPNHSLMLQLS